MKTHNTFLAHILPNDDLFDGTRILPLSNPDFKSLIIQSMQAFVDKTQPSVLIEHKREGKVYGKVLGVFGDDEGIYATFEVNEEIAEGIENGEYRFVSPTIAWNFKADDYKEYEDNVYPAALLELSLVSIPRHYTRQQDLQELNVSMMGVYHAWDGSYYALQGAERATLMPGIDKHLKGLLGD